MIGLIGSETSADETLVGFHADAHAVFLAEADHFGLLDQVDAQGVGGAGITPGHCVVTGNAAAALQRGAEDWITGVLRAVQVRDHLRHLPGIDHFTVDAVEAVGADPALDVAHVLQGVTEAEHAALGKHYVVVDVLGQAFPQLHRVFIETCRFVPQVVGTNDGGVARGVATAQPAFLDDGDVLYAELLRQVVRRGQTMAATADDDHIVDRLGLGVAPHALPVFVMAE